MKTETGFPLIQLEQVQVLFGSNKAINDVSFDLDAASFNVLIGSSGAGKSTTIKLINGLVRASSGKVLLFGKNIESIRGKKLRLLRSKIGYIPQDLGLVEPATAEENVLMGSLPTLLFPRMGAWMYPKQLRVRANEILLELGMEDFSNVRVSDLSGGQRQRVAIGRSLMQGAEILLADEPISSLDQVIAEDVLSLLKNIASSHGITLLISLHQVELAKRFADRIIALRDGSILFDGQPKSLTAAKIQRIYER